MKVACTSSVPGHQSAHLLDSFQRAGATIDTDPDLLICHKNSEHARFKLSLEADDEADFCTNEVPTIFDPAEIQRLRQQYLLTEKTKFCCMVLASDSVPNVANLRELALTLSRYRRIDLAGSAMQNGPLAPSDPNVRLEWLSHYKFVICTCEADVLAAVCAGSVALYRNPLALDIIQEVKDLDVDPIKYQQMSEQQLQEYVESYLLWLDDFTVKILRLTRRHLVTFAAGRFANAGSRLLQQAHFLRLASHHLYNDIDPSWLKELQPAQDATWLQRRGHGYYFWKCRYILQTMQQLNDNEILIYLDAGCLIRPQMKQWRRYFRELVDHDLLVFQLEHQEKYWSKRALYQALQLMPDESAQLVGGIHIWKKTLATMHLLQEWVKYTSEIALLDDSLGEEIEGFQEHRHDQSIFSLLVKSLSQQGKLTVKILPDETWPEQGQAIYAARSTI